MSLSVALLLRAVDEGKRRHDLQPTDMRRDGSDRLRPVSSLQLDTIPRGGRSQPQRKTEAGQLPRDTVQNIVCHEGCSRRCPENLLEA